MKEYKKVCLKINGKESVKLKIGSIKFNNYFKQLAIQFMIYADFESILKRVQSNDRNNNTSDTEKYQAHLPCSFAYKVVCLDDKVSNLVVLYRGKDAVNKYIKAIRKENGYCKKIIKKYFNKSLLMFAEDEKRFQSSNKCSICNRFFAAEDNKVRDHDHVTEKYRSSAHWSCNINLKLTKNASVIFHNFKGYGSHWIVQESGKCECIRKIQGFYSKLKLGFYWQHAIYGF